MGLCVTFLIDQIKANYLTPTNMQRELATSTKENIFLVVIALFLFALLNVASGYIILSLIGTSIYDPAYSEVQQKYVKKYGNKVHPFYGQVAGRIVGFGSDISVEKNFSTVSGMPQDSDAEVKVLVLGGSVASHLSRYPLSNVPDNLLADELNKRFRTDRFVVYNAAFGGGKQPQQYFKLLYLDFLGFRPDVIINLDGFNEIALPLVENYQRRLNAAYPRSFDELVFSSAYDGSCFETNNYLLSFNSRLPVVEAFKWAFVKYCHEASVQVGSNGFVENELFEAEKQVYPQRALKIWEGASNKISDFSFRHSIPYLHFIQPNQHLEGSKPLTKSEQEISSKYEPYKSAINRHYGTLSSDSLETKYKFDYRYLFENEQREAYSDDCCHLNKFGMEMMVEAMISDGYPVFEAELVKGQ